MSTLTAYCFGTRRQSEIIEPVIVTLKNGRKAVRGKAKDAPQYTVFRTLSDHEAKEVEAMLSQS